MCAIVMPMKGLNADSVFRVVMMRRQESKKRKSDEDPFEKIRSFMGRDHSIDVENNHIYFYTDVDEDSCLELNRKINNLNKSLLKYAIEYDCEPPNIYLHISSYGGCLFSAFSVVDTIKNSRVPIVSIIEGKAASAATIISMVCHKRYMSKNSFMLIHQLSSFSMGKYEALKDDFMNDTKLMELIYKLYREHTSLSDKEIKKCLQRDIWWDSAECLKAGLVDSLWESLTSMHVKHLFKEVSYDTKDSVEKNEVEEKPKRRKRNAQ
jgi:ATP-dependent Clp protease, protease subunit